MLPQHNPYLLESTRHSPQRQRQRLDHRLVKGHHRQAFPAIRPHHLPFATRPPFRLLAPTPFLPTPIKRLPTAARGVLPQVLSQHPRQPRARRSTSQLSIGTLPVPLPVPFHGSRAAQTPHRSEVAQLRPTTARKTPLGQLPTRPRPIPHPLRNTVRAKASVGVLLRTRPLENRAPRRDQIPKALKSTR